MKLFIEYLIGSMFLSWFVIYSGKRLFKHKFNNILKLTLISVILIISITIDYMLLDNIAKTAVSYLIILICYIYLFHKPILKCAISVFVTYILFALGEVSFIITLSLLNYIGVSINIMDLSGSIFTNLIVVLFSTLYLLMIHKPLSKVLEKIKENNKIILIITFILFVTVNCVLFYKLYFNKYQINNELILNLVLLVALSYVAFILIKQQYDKSKLSDEYERYVEYSKQSEKLVDQYCMTLHENKNELIIIRSMVNKNNKQLIEYLDEILMHKENINQDWIRSLRYIPFGGLKGIIHNKISEMKDNNINVFLNIGKDINNSNLKQLTTRENNQLSKIIGVFLDNAKEAAQLSLEKEVSICVYIERSEIVFEISNTYVKGFDVAKMYDMGTTSKGNGRGYGLALVDSILKENKIFKNEVKQIDNYFVQTLRIVI